MVRMTKWGCGDYHHDEHLIAVIMTESAKRLRCLYDYDYYHLADGRWVTSTVTYIHLAGVRWLVRAWCQPPTCTRVVLHLWRRPRRQAKPKRRAKRSACWDREAARWRGGVCGESREEAKRREDG